MNGNDQPQGRSVRHGCAGWRVCGGPPGAEATAGRAQQRIKKIRERATRMT
ncbi:hypothetical protein ACIP4W_31140 [Streptomyces sp. NPDC088846]|uniref:hypothetical protein n=1 Tax=Streptomyces sp. NPDC088846 TaxID=3365908 RepID=UPI0037F29010